MDTQDHAKSPAESNPRLIAGDFCFLDLTSVPRCDIVLRMALGNGKPKRQWNHLDWLVHLLEEAGNVNYDAALTQASVLLAHPEFYMNAATEAGIFVDVDHDSDGEETDTDS